MRVSGHRNGTGKSRKRLGFQRMYPAPLTCREYTALLQAIADKLIPGLSPSLRIVLVSQVEDSSRALDSSLPDDVSVLQHVIHGDAKREAAMQEFNCTLCLSPLNTAIVF